MKKIEDYKNEAALDLLVEIMEPAVELMSDKEAVAKLYTEKERMQGVKDLIKNHKSAVTRIFAAIDGVPVEEYEYSLIMVPLRLLEIVNNKEMLAFFTAQQSQDSNGVSGNAMETITEKDN